MQIANTINFFIMKIVLNKIKANYPNVPTVCYIKHSGSLIERMASTGVDIVLNGTIHEGLYTTATYAYNDIVIDQKDGRGELAADFSRKHVATLGLTWEINDRWKVAGRYKYLSGRPDDNFIIHSDVLGAGQPLRYSKEITQPNVGRQSGYSLLNLRVDYRRAFGPLDVTAFLDVINLTAASSGDDTEFDYRRGVEVKDDSEAEPLIGLRFDYAW